MRDDAMGTDHGIVQYCTLRLDGLRFAAYAHFIAGLDITERPGDREIRCSSARLVDWTHHDTGRVSAAR
jgi:hypothetical protein